MLSNQFLIKKPLESILEEFSIATVGIKGNIEEYSLINYMFDSVFIRMTGFQEQKIKALAWEMGGSSLDFRRKLLNELKLGEYSSLESKETVYKNLLDILDQEFKCNIELDSNRKNSIISGVFDAMDSIFENSGIVRLTQKEYRFYKQNRKLIFKPDQFAVIQSGSNKLLNTGLSDIYSSLYKRRNKIAHNIPSLYRRTPDFSDFSKIEEKLNNHYMWFTVLIIIDKVLLTLYETMIHENNLNPDRY